MFLTEKLYSNDLIGIMHYAHEQKMLLIGAG